jgi:SAM-dependent methyltransferase
MNIKYFNIIKNWINRPRSQLIPSIFNKIYGVLYLLFEYKNSFDFSGYISISKIDGSIYHGYSPYYLKILLKETNIPDFNCYNFIDIGSGKGRICIYASYYPFKKIIGVEYSDFLFNISKNNLALTNFKNCEFLCENAVNYLIPHGNTIIFLFNPFNATILNEFLKKNLNHFKTNNSIIIYTNDIYFKTIENLGFDRRISNSIWKTSLFRYKKILN